MRKTRKAVPRMLSCVCTIGLLMLALLSTPNPAKANPTLYPGLWVDITPPAAQVGLAYGLNMFTQGVTLDQNNLNTLYFCMTGYNPTTFAARPANIWKTTDAGSDWTALTPMDAPIHVRIDPNNSNHLYAVDGVRGNTSGFWISTDGGATWAIPAGFTTMANNLGNEGYPGMLDSYCVNAEPGNFNHLLVSNHSAYSTIGESTDGGTTWVSHIVPAELNTGGYDVFFLESPDHDVGNSGTWLLCTQYDGMWRTTDSGNTWTETNSNGMPHGGDQIFYNASDVLFIGSTVGPEKSTDNGVTWQSASSGWPGSNYQSQGIIGDGNLLYVGTWTHASGFFTSPETDGLNWTQYNGGSTSAITGPMEMAYDSTNRIVYSSNTDNGPVSTTMNGIWALKLPNAGAPTSLTGLTAVSGNAQIALSWTASSGATSYNVLRSTVLSQNCTGAWTGYSQVANVTSTSYTDTGLANNTTYYYIVQAANSSGVFSCQTFGVPASAPPSAPTGLTATAGNVEVTLAWTASPTATSYNVYCSTVSGSGYVEVASGLKFEGVQTTSYPDYTSSPSSYLVNGETYYFVVTATNAAGVSGNSNQVSAVPTGVPAAPTSLTATPGNAQVALSWAASSGATSYNVLSSTINGSGYASVATGVSTTTYTNTGLTNGTTYYYVVTAVNSLGTSGNSNQASATPSASAPAAPTGLTAAAGNAQVVLNWTGSSGATSYNVLNSTVSGSGYASVATGISTTTYTNTGLTNGKTYYYVVTAVNSSGTSADSNQASATPVAGAPSAPTGLMAAPGNTQIALAWTASSGATSYNVLRSTVSGSGYASVVTGVTVTNYTNTGLTNGTTYYFVVTAVNASGTSGDSNQASASPGTYTINYGSGFTSSGLQLNGNAALNGTNLEITNGTGGQQSSAFYITPVNVANFSTAFSLQDTSAVANGLTFCLQTVGDTALYTGGAGSGMGYQGMPTSVAVKFDLFTVVNGNTNSTGIYTDGAAPTTPATDLTPSGVVLSSGHVINVTMSYNGTTLTVTETDATTQATATQTYTINIPSTVGASTAYAGFTGATGGLAAVQQILTWTYSGGGGSGAPPAPTGLTAAAGNAQVALSWTASSGATSYNVYRGTTAGGESATAIVTGVTTTAYTNSGLTNGTTYYYKVAALNSSGTSGMSNEASATPVAPPSAPTGLTATPGNTQVGLSWTASGGATSYNVLRSTVSGSGYASVVTGVATTGYTNTGLTNGTTYYFVVAAVNAGGTSANSAQASAVPQVSAPAAPTALSATPGNTQAALSWTASSGATSYNVYRGTSSGGESATAIATGITTTTYTNTGLTNGTTYYFTVKALNSGGTSPASNEASATPASGVPSAPTGLTASGGNAQVVLAWTASSGATSYNVLRSTVSGSGYASVTTGVTTTGYTNTGLTNGTTYYFVVTAVNSAGTSGNSNQASATPAAYTINYSSGFTTTGLQLNGNSALNGTNLELTNGGAAEQSSAFYKTLVNVANFSTAFSLQDTSAQANGVTFCIQTVGDTALYTVGNGAGMGYQGMPTSVAVKFDVFTVVNGNTNSTGLYTDGAEPSTPATDLTPSGVVLSSGHVIDVTMSYNGTTLTVTEKDATTLATATQTYTINIPSTVGASTAYVGFTGATGGETATQQILTWTY